MKLKIMPDGYFTISLVLAIVLHSVSPIIKLIAFPYSLLGVFLIMIGLLIAFTTNSILIKKRTALKPFETPLTLITSGPFKFSRNPIYLGMTVILLGIVISLGSLSSIISPILFVVIINKLIIPVEEQTLKKVFGEKYIDYKTKVRRWL